MSERIIKWGFIGCGEVTKYKSGPAFQKIENSEVVAVMSRNGDKAKTYAKERTAFPKKRVFHVLLRTTAAICPTS